MGKDGGLLFRCPCDWRWVSISAKVHGISFDAAGRLTLNGSCGYTKTEEHPEHWCHFWLKGGLPEMCEGAMCPGGEVSS